MRPAPVVAIAIAAIVPITPVVVWSPLVAVKGRSVGSARLSVVCRVFTGTIAVSSLGAPAVAIVPVAIVPVSIRRTTRSNAGR